MKSTTRRSHQKVRTGCLSCKIRRKKCDEAKPFCRRCRIAGVKCDGYAPLFIVSAQTSKNIGPSIPELDDDFRTSLHHPAVLQDCSSNSDTSISWSSPTTPETDDDFKRSGVVQKPYYEAASPFVVWSEQPQMFLSRLPNALADLQTLSDLEVHCYSYFRHNTVPRLATYFENFMWRMDIRNAALNIQHPVLFKAVIALGAVHRRLSYGISREAFEYCAHAARLYNDAVESLGTLRKSRSNNSDRQIISACEALLGIFQGFQADTEASATHIQSAVREAISAPVRLLHSESWHYANPSPPRLLCGMIYQLCCRATEVYGESALTYSPAEDTYYRTVVSPIVFGSLGEMKIELFGIVEDAWRRYRFEEDLVRRRIDLQIYENRLHDWTTACLRTLDSGFVLRPAQVKAFNLLSISHSALCVSIQGLLLTTDQPELRRIPQLPTYTSSGNDYCDAAVQLRQAVDFMYTIKNADLSRVKSIVEQTLAKHEIFSFETRLPNSDSDIDEMLNLWTIAKRVGEVEEAALIEALRDVIPPGAMNVDIGDIWRERRKVMLRYYERDYSQHGFRWVTQFWSF